MKVEASSVDMKELKKVMVSLNDSGILESLGIKKLKTVGVKKVDMIDNFIDAVTKIGEEGKEDGLDDAVIEFYNTLVEGEDEDENEDVEDEDTEDVEDEEDDEEDEDEDDLEDDEDIEDEDLEDDEDVLDEDETDDSEEEGKFNSDINSGHKEWTADEINALKKEELIDLIERNKLDVDTKQKIPAMKKGVLAEMGLSGVSKGDEAPKKDTKKKETKKESKKKDTTKKEKKEPKKKDAEAKSAFGHLLSKQTGQMDAMFEKGASYAEIQKEIGSENKDITRHLRRLKKKGYTILKKDADDPMATVYRVKIEE